jgi:hypothetical protein
MVLPGFAQFSYVSSRFLKEPIAQPVEHLTFNQRVDGSNPSGLTNKIKELRPEQTRTVTAFYKRKRRVLQTPFIRRSGTFDRFPF